MRIKNQIRIFKALLVITFLTAGFHSAGAQESKSGLDEKNFLSLKGCVKFAVDNSFVVKLAKLDFLIEETELGKDEAVFDTTLFANIGHSEDKRESLSVFGPGKVKTTPYTAGASKKFPAGTKLTLSVSDTRTWNDSEYVSQNPSHTAVAALEARQPLAKNLFGQIDRQNISMTKLVIQNADLLTKERIETLIAEVEKAYWEWLYFEENSDIYCRILERAKRLHKVNASNYDLGRIEKGDFLASQANVLRKETDLAIAENKYRQAEEKIKLLMNMDAELRIHPAEKLRHHKIEYRLDNCLQTAFQKRRDYKMAKKDMEIRNIDLKIKVNERWPEIDLTASFAANGIDSDFSKAAGKIDEDNSYYYAGVEISFPLENNRARSAFKRARHNKEKALILIKKLEREIITEIGDAFRNYSTYGINLTRVKKTARLQQEKLKEEEKRFNYGRSNTKKLIDYQQDDLRAQLEVSLGMLAYELSRVNLEKALNIILEKYEDKV
ncbi:MAG: TolC family protein [Candidatus Ratteibacteria bacterium]|nr:TolC family protein [Candidatus Ratteibacteria bacterium]